MDPQTDPAQVLHGGAASLRRGRGIGDRQDVGHVEQHPSQEDVIPGLSGKPRALTEVGDRL